MVNAMDVNETRTMIRIGNITVYEETRYLKMGIQQ